jgi:hypothetical protein
MIEQNAKLKGKIKMMGVGMKDDIHYVNFFRKQFKVPFPLFPDKELAFHQLVGKPEVPFFVGLKLKKGGKKEIFYTRLGPVEGGAAEFLQLIVKKAGLK